MEFLASLVAQHLPSSQCGGAQTIKGKDVRSSFRFVNVMEDYVVDVQSGDMDQVGIEEQRRPPGGAPIDSKPHDDNDRKPDEVQGPLPKEYRTSATPPMRFNYVVPEGVEPGSVITIEGPHGKLGVKVPDDAKPGDQTAAWLGPVYQSVVPDGKKAGDLIIAKLRDGKEISIVVPEGKRCGEAFDFCPPVLMVRVPEGARPGDIAKFTGPDGNEHAAPIPATVDASGYFEWQAEATKGPGIHRAHATLPMTIQFNVPEGAAPGSELVVDGPHGKMKAIVPLDVSPGQQVSIWIGPSIKYMATVPEGKKPGDTIALELSDGKSIVVCVADGKQPGDTFEFAPPVLMVQVPKGSKPGDLLVFATPEGREEHVEVPEGIQPLQYFDVPFNPEPRAPPASTPPALPQPDEAGSKEAQASLPQSGKEPQTSLLDDVSTYDAQQFAAPQEDLIGL